MKTRFFRNPIKWYIEQVKDSVEPTDLSHRVRMHIDIKKGETKGRALIPCSIYSFDHSIDLNPALIRKKDKKKIKEFPVNTKFTYDSRKYDVELTEQEKKQGYTLEELDMCEHCGQKLVIAEVAETRYRSCPDIKVRVADKAKEDLRIPVDFGINLSDVRGGMIWSWVLLDSMIALMILVQFFHVKPMDWISLPGKLMVVYLPHWLLWLILVPLLLFFSVWFLVIVGKIHYKAYRLWRWWSEVKSSVVEVDK